MQNIDPELLARILRGEPVDEYMLGRGNAIWDPNLSADQQNPNAFEDVIYGGTSKDGWTTNKWNTWNKDGTYRGAGSGDSDALSTLKFLATAAAGYYGGNALAGLGEGAAAAGAGAGEAAGGSALDALLAGGGYGADAGTLVGGSALTSGGTSALGTTLADAGIMSAAGGGGLGMLGSAAGSAGSLGSLGSAGSVGSAGSTASTLSNMADAAKTASSGLNLGGVLGAAAGALSSKDQQQTTSRDPWAPAQPMLKGLIDQLPALQQQYAQQPFNDAQKAGYNNYAGLLDLVNRNAGGLLSGAQANASGQNQFVRGQPRGLIGSSFNPTAQEWSPQSYGRFGG